MVSGMSMDNVPASSAFAGSEASRDIEAAVMTKQDLPFVANESWHQFSRPVGKHKPQCGGM